MSKKEIYSVNITGGVEQIMRNSNVSDIYKKRLEKELEKVMGKRAPKLWEQIKDQMEYLPIGMLEGFMIDYGLEDKIEGRYVIYKD